MVTIVIMLTGKFIVFAGVSAEKSTVMPKLVTHYIETITIVRMTY